MGGINETTGLNLSTAKAFAGVNYLESLADVKSPGFSALEKLYVDNPESGGFLQHDVSSIFNKFAVFQYSALNAGSKYRQEGHFIGFANNLKSDDQYADQSSSDAQLVAKRVKLLETLVGGSESQKKIAADQFAIMKTINQQAKSFKSTIDNTLSNPTAPTLIKWGAEKSGASTVGFQPYSLTDFMFCKDYGKIPNNRLITLRRYPFPIADSLRLGQTDRRNNALPIAQAVTWFGSDTTNTLSNIGVFKWDMGFEMLEATEQTITGNEVTLKDLLELVSGAGGKAGEAIKKSLEAVYAATSGKDSSIKEISGYEAKIQEYQKGLYDATKGPYWNRIYGPVNVVNKTTRRTRGMQNTNWQTTFSLNFRYSFRSFNGMSPKVVALDLISNFINLTYNDAQFQGQFARYFPKLGLKMSPAVTEAFGNILTNWGTTYSGNNADQYNTIIASMTAALEVAGSKVQNDLVGTGAKTIQTAFVGTALAGKALPELISVKAALSDRPVGEWHMVVGNPVNPIFVMGDLLCTNVEMKWDDELGPDDFPTGVSFAVTLKQGKPRDKTAIERMLNLGETKLTSGALRTSSESDTFGEANNKLWNEIESSAAGGQKATLEAYYKSLTDAGTADRYNKFRDRFLVGYGVTDKKATGSMNATNDKSAIDDSLLLFYYQRQYGKN